MKWIALTTLLAAVIAAPAIAASSDGRQIYTTNCAVCHGQTGGGGYGPSLQQIAARRSFDQTVAFIENPLGPMPKLYPEKLSDSQVRAVATYIRTTFTQAGTANAQYCGAAAMHGGMMGPGMMGPGMMYGCGRGGAMGPGMMYGYGPGGYGPGMMYGPGGGYQNNPAALNLSVADVTRYFEQWLAAQGNQNVKLGVVKEIDANTITAEIVTKNNSLVERYEINRHTGYMRPLP